jgi:Zn-dependent peptidase ImmA (M78 family)
VSKVVPFLTRNHIEVESEGLLAAYGAKYGLVSKAPIPVDEILNVHLKVTLDFDDLPKLLRVNSDVFGATWIEQQQVIIDQSLDPTNNPERIGRYNFTVAHETGHWQLHRPFLLKDINQKLLFEQAHTAAIVCRSSEAKEPIEWQADFFAACLLMPKDILTEAWRARYGDQKLTLGEIQQRMRIKNVARVATNETDDKIIEAFVRPLAREFGVSPIAMRIRVENLGLLIREFSETLFLDVLKQINRAREA